MPLAKLAHHTPFSSFFSRSLFHGELISMSSAYGKINRPDDYDASKLHSLVPIEFVTQSNRVVSVHCLANVLPLVADESKLLTYLQSLLNEEIEAGNTYPQKSPLSLSEFENYFLSGDVFIALNCGRTLSSDVFDDLAANVLGTFYIKPNFPGRCSHVMYRSFCLLRITVPNVDLQCRIYHGNCAPKPRYRQSHGVGISSHRSRVGLQGVHV